MKPRRVVKAAAYDALELSALMYGGIGAGQCAVNPDHFGDEPRARPLCLLGHCIAAELRLGGAMSGAFAGVGVYSSANDEAVRSINARKGRHRNARVTFAEWCAELGVRRGR